jgi:hypothetical protein
MNVVLNLPPSYVRQDSKTVEVRAPVRLPAVFGSQKVERLLSPRLWRRKYLMMKPMIGSLTGKVQPGPHSHLFVTTTLELDRYQYLVYNLE